jgi:large subunit ribosomal protein L9
MQVILLEKIAKLGGLGDLANVKPGYARNYLFPKGKAQPATKANLEAFEKIKKDLEAKEAKVLKEAQAIEKKMTGVVCNIAANASEEGKLFGSISAAEIVQNLADQGFEIEKKNINIPEAIRYIGEYEISVSLHSDISVPVKVAVEAVTSEEA